MTIIEFFDHSALENVISCVALSPEKIIYVGVREMMERFEPSLRRFFALRGSAVEVEFVYINRNDIRTVIEALIGILKREPVCDFDLTGGNELALFASGVAFAKHPEKKINVHAFNVRTGRIHDCDLDGKVSEIETPRLTVEENIVLHGGSIVTRTAADYWLSSDTAKAELGAMWDVCKTDPPVWNLLSSVLGMTVPDGSPEPTLKVTLDIERIRNSQPPKKVTKLLAMLRKLDAAGVLRFAEAGDTFTVTYANEHVKKCMTKAGDILELRTLLAIRSITDKKKAPKFNDAETGVFIDWDGALHGGEGYDTTNEIDVIAMRGMIPVFISCKNGSVDEEELYKLNTVTGRFGGRYAKKILVATSLKRNSSSMEFFRQRAKDMHIELVEDVNELDDEAFARALNGAIGL